MAKSTVCPVHGDKYQRADFRCSACLHQHNDTRVGKRARQKQDKPLSYNLDKRMHALKDSRGVVSVDALQAKLRHLEKNPEEALELMLESRRLPGVSKERFSIAGRAAIKEPMLNASQSSIENSLDWRKAHESLKKRSLAKGELISQIVVKPTSVKTAKYGRNSPFWGERAWRIFSLRYSRGFVVRTDIGDDSRVFPTIGEVKSAVKKSGWEIVR